MTTVGNVMETSGGDNVLQPRSPLADQFSYRNKGSEADNILSKKARITGTSDNILKNK